MVSINPRDWFWLNRLKKRLRYVAAQQRAQMPAAWSPRPLHNIRRLP